MTSDLPHSCNEKLNQKNDHISFNMSVLLNDEPFWNNVRQLPQMLTHRKIKRIPLKRAPSYEKYRPSWKKINL